MGHKGINPYWRDIEESLEAIVYEGVEEWKYLGNHLGDTEVIIAEDQGKLKGVLEALRSTCTGTSQIFLVSGLSSIASP